MVYRDCHYTFMARIFTIQASYRSSMQNAANEVRNLTTF